MWSRTAALVFAAVGALLAGLPVFAADEDVERLRYDRERLIERALQSVDPADPAAGGLDDLKQTVETRRELFARVAPELLEEAHDLLGPRTTAGLIQDGAVLWRWVNGTAEEGPTLELADPAQEGVRKAYPLPEDLANREEIEVTWELVVQRRENGTIAGPGLNKLRYVAGPGASEALRYVALTDAEELERTICKEWIEAREVQVPLRVKRYGAEQPSKGLVNEGIVAQKAKRSKAYADRVAAVAAERATMRGSIERLIDTERALLEEAGRLGFEIEEAKRSAGEAPDGAASEKLARLQLEEIVGEQKLRLLYLTVRRAALRMQLYDESLRQWKDESDAADAAFQRFEAELSRLRRIRQLDRLGSEARTLKQRHESAHKQAEDPEEAERPLYQAYDAALEALIVVNRTTAEAVQTRRAIERLTKPEQVAREGSGGLTPAPAPGAPGEPAGGEEAASAPAPGPGPAATPDPLRRFRNPTHGAMDVAYVRDAAEMLGHPDWDADLAARHHDVVADRIHALERALRTIDGTRVLPARFEAAAATAAKALDKTAELGRASSQASRWRQWIRWLRQKALETNVNAFNETMAAIDEARTQVDEELRAFREYSSQLLDLGSRSFTIRVQRELGGERLGAAFDDAADTVEQVGHWVTLRGESHVGTFLAGHWWKLLICLAVVVGSVLAVKLGRKALDRVARHMATRVPQLRAEPVTVRAEEAEVRREKAVLEAAAKQAEEAALKAVTKGEAARTQKMGEGGYGGGAE
jgi:hypothetical protein